MYYVYDVIVDTISKTPLAFDALAKHLYPLMGLNKLTVNDLRPVDIKEFFHKIKTNMPKDLSYKSSDSVDCYCFILGRYLNQLNCESGSRADRYKTYAWDLMEKACAEKEISRPLDSLLITLSLYRVLGNDLDTSTIIHNANIETSCNDFDLLRRICEKKAIVPTIKQEVSVETGTFKRKTEKYYRDVKISDDTIRWFHINSILHLCYMLNMRCVFDDLGGAQSDGQSCAD